jgi:hypothetical protein
MRRENKALFQQVLIDLDERPGTALYDELIKKMYYDYQRGKGWPGSQKETETSAIAGIA